MTTFKLYLALSFSISVILCHTLTGQADQENYLDSIKSEMRIMWPNNRTVKIIFHGHSVPAGYFRNAKVESLNSYPYLLLSKLNEAYPFALINPIVTALGGEESDKGSLRFQNDVLALKPDVIFIDYSLNDRRIGLEKANQAWSSMISSALDKDIKVILLTPTPDLKEDILDQNSPLAMHSSQVRALAKDFEVGLVDSYSLFKTIAQNGRSLEAYMSQNNHPNAIGHDIVANEILKWFLRQTSEE